MDHSSNRDRTEVENDCGRCDRRDVFAIIRTRRSEGCTSCDCNGEQLEINAPSRSLMASAWRRSIVAGGCKLNDAKYESIAIEACM